MPRDDQVALAGVVYDLVHDDQVPRGKRMWEREVIKSDISDPGVIKTARWDISGPVGVSREGPDGYLGVDYAIDLDHRYRQLLTSGPKRNALTLTTLSSRQEIVPTSDITKTNWSEGAGDADGSAFDELDEGSGSVDSTGTYWKVGTDSDFLTVGLASPASTVPTGVSVTAALNSFVIGVQLKHTTTSEHNDWEIRLYQGTTVLWSRTRTNSSITDWLSVTESLPQSVADQITDWTDLRIGIRRSGAPASAGGEMHVSALWLVVPATDGGHVVSMVEDRSQFFVSRGSFTTQINPTDMLEVDSEDHGAPVKSSVVWAGAGYVALDKDADIDKRTAVTAASSTYSAVSGVDARALAVGANKLWLVDAGKNTAADENTVKFATAAVTGAGNLSNPIRVIDPGSDATGIYTQGPYALFGYERGVNSYTDRGTPTELLDAIKKFPSVQNAGQGASLWGYTYIATELGLYAVNVARGFANPVGPGEGLRGQDFEGPLDGFPTAVETLGELLFVAYRNADGSSWTYIGQFGTETGTTGRPEWYTFRRLPSTECNEIGIIASRPNPTVVLAEDGDVSWYTTSHQSRWIADSNYEFSVDGGTWYGTTMMRAAGMLINVRAIKFLTENCNANRTWQAAVSMDEGSYVDVGTFVSTNGLQTKRPSLSGAPLATVSGSTLKPRLVQTNDSESTPAQIRGFLDIEYDERPETVGKHVFAIKMNRQSSAKIYAALRDLIDRRKAAGKTPQQIVLPGGDDPVDRQYGYVTDISGVTDIDGKGTQVVFVTVLDWTI